MDTAGPSSVHTDCCPVCEGGVDQAVLAIHNDKDTEYKLRLCTVCGVQFWSPFSNPGSSWYEHDERYSSRNADPILKPNKKHRVTVAYFKGREGTVLDVGCGVGNFLAYAQEHGWCCWGIDFDHDAIAAGQRVFDLKNLEASDLSGFRQAHPEAHFELLTFFDVLEHLDDHKDFFHGVKSLLLPEGHIALSVPYRHAWRWLIPADLPPRHLTRWDESSIVSALRHHGFEVRRIFRFPASIYYIALKLRFRYGRWSSIGLVSRVKKKADKSDSKAAKPHHGNAVGLAQSVAKVKDMLLFGLPALLIWIVLLPSNKRYSDLCVIAQIK